MIHGLNRMLAPDRVGRFGRQRAWELQLSWVRRFWPAVAFLPVAPSALAILFATTDLSGVASGLVVGGGVMSGVWLAVLVTVVSSGAVSQLMSIAAEGWTASDLHPLRRHGWRITNGLKFRDREDIDHVAAGPAGLLVVETKWSAQPWPLDGTPGFMRAQMDDAIRQTARNAALVRSFFTRVRHDAPVIAALVLFSAQGYPDAGPCWIERDGPGIGPVAHQVAAFLLRNGLVTDPFYVNGVLSITDLGRLVLQLIGEDSKEDDPEPTEAEG